MREAVANPEYWHRANSIALARLPKEEIDTHRGEYAIIVDGKVCAYHASNREALLEAHRRFAMMHFSVRKVETQPVDVGFIDLGDYRR